MLRRLRQLAVGIAGLTAPLTVSAQGIGSVTVAPLGAATPALGLPALGALALALALGGFVMLRRSGHTGARVLGVLALVLAAAVGHAAVSNVIISGDECHQLTQEDYAPLANVELQSECANPIRIVDVHLTCSAPGSEASGQSVPNPQCEVGLVVPPGTACELPSCES